MPASEIKLIYLNNTGKLNRAPDGAITNIGGTTSHSFTINGKGVMLEDGSTSSGGTGYTLQTIYNNSTDSNNNASIKLNTGKDFVIYDDTNNAIFFKVDSETGAITITGDLTVQGNATLLGSAVQTADHLVINTTSPSVPAFVIEPSPSIVPTANLIDIKQVNGGGSVFKVSGLGITTAKSLEVTNNITVLGTINGIDIVDLNNQLQSHLTSSAALKHAATEVSVLPVPQAPGAVNVQDALNALGTAIQNVSSVASTIHPIEFLQMAPADTWYIQHNQNTKRIQWSLWDENDESITPDRVAIIDNNNMRVYWGAPQTGRIILMCF
jgi:hypothetical protein